LVTGSLNEEKAVEFMKAGAADYILKDHLTRLPEAIRRALRERALREEREQAVAALRESEAQYRSLFESTPYPMWVFDLETHRVLAVNGAAITHYGYSREEFLALRIEDLRLPEDVPALHRHLATMPSDYHAAGTWRHRKKDGTLIEVETGGQGITFAGRQAEQVVINDVKGGKGIEEEFRQGQKMEAVGRPAAGLAHDFNHPLTAIQVEHPHGVWRALEQGAVLGLRLPQRGDGLLALFAERPLTQGPTDRLGQSRQVILQDVIRGAGLHELDRFFLVERARDQNDREGGGALL